MNEHPFREIFGDNGVRIALTGVLAILALFLLAQTIVAATNFGRPSVPATDTITVQGTGQATLPPDVARITFTVQHSAAAVADAQTKTINQTNLAITYLKEQGIADKDVRTLSYNISPEYSYPNPCQPGMICPAYVNSPKITGYQVSESIQVTVRDLSAVGTILGGLGNLAVQNVSGPNFALDDSTAGYAAARADAIEKARTQAELLAKQLDVRLGKIVNFSESSNGGGYPLYAMEMRGAADQKSAPVANVPAGENTYNASVSITYSIR